VDGRAAGQIDQNFVAFAGPSWWKMADDGVLTMVAEDQGTVKRLRITPPADTSIDTMLAAARPVQ
jgi:hypothetical protein